MLDSNRALHGVSRAQRTLSTSSCAMALPRDRADVNDQINRLHAHLPKISHSALSAFLKAANDTPNLPCVSRKRIREARNEACLSTTTPYGPLHHEIDIGGVQVEIQSPFAMLYHCSKLPGFAPLLSDCASAAPGSAYNATLAVYADEITPGNPLANKVTRKSWAIYWSILEWGPEALSNEDPWGIYTMGRGAL